MKDISIKTRNRWFCTNPFNMVHFILAVILAGWLMSHGRYFGELIFYSIAGRYLYALTTNEKIEDLHWGKTVLAIPLFMWVVNWVLNYLFN